MAARTTADRVKEIITTSLSDELVASNMVETANVLVTTHLASSGLSTTILELIEMYLAAHFVALTEERGGLTRTEFGEAEEWYSDIYGEGLKATRFGQTALSLDSSGLLADATAGAGSLKAQFRVV